MSCFLTELMRCFSEQIYSLFTHYYHCFTPVLCINMTVNTVIYVIYVSSFLISHYNALTLNDRNLTSQVYEKNSFLDVSEQMCVNKWTQFIKHTLHNRTTDALIHPDGYPNFPYVVSPNNKQKILMIHVGKTGGQTVTSHLKHKGIQYQFIHLHAVDREVLSLFDVIIIGLRHPVERLISAYYYSRQFMHKSKSSRRRLELNDEAQKFYHCSPTLKAFANNLYAATPCGDVARGDPPTFNGMHIHMDTCAYLGGIVNDLLNPKKEVFIINEECLIDDLNYVSEKLRWRKKFSENDKFDKHVMPADSRPLNSALTLMQFGGYMELSGEVALYNKLQSHFSRIPLSA